MSRKTTQRRIVDKALRYVEEGTPGPAAFQRALSEVHASPDAQRLAELVWHKLRGDS
jgi:hypothetical protein